MDDHDAIGVVNDSISRKVVGDLACQHDTYLTTLTTRVYGCTKSKKGKGDEAYELQLYDTILFPEGGGQPWDHGYLITDNAKIKINKILRRKLEAIHFSAQPIEEETEVRVELQWERRIDHAQQHSGQHLLSAVLDQYDIPTISWAMGTDIVYVEVANLPENLHEVEDKCNDYIRQNLPITVRQTSERKESDLKDLPADYDASAGVVRIVSIGGIDQNPCCGTHVRSTSELNSLSILYTSTIRGSNSRIHFVVGGRVQKQLRDVYNRNRGVGTLLSCGLPEIPDKVVGLQSQMKELMKTERLLKAELAAIDSKNLEDALRSSGKGFMHRPFGDTEFLNQVLSLMDQPLSGLCVMVAGEISGSSIIIAGPHDEVKRVSEELKTQVPGIKGGGRSGKWQGKSPSLTASDLAVLRNFTE